MIRVLCAASVAGILLLAASAAGADDFLGSVQVGYGELLRPDAVNATGASLRKGGVQAYFQGLWGEERFKYGAETGIIEAYTNWDKHGRFIYEYSLSFIPINGLAQYEFTDSGNRAVPFVFAGTGAYFPIEGGSSAEVQGDSGNSSSSKAYLGVTSGGGLRWRVTPKLDMILSFRHTYVNAPDNVSVFGVSLGAAGRVSFTKKERPAEIKMRPVQQDDKP